MLDKSAKVADPNICPGYLHEWVKRISDEAHMEVKNVHYSTRNGMATAEFLAPDFRGKTVNQESLLACNVKEDVYIDIHVSKTDFQASDDPMLTSSMDSVRFVSIAQLSKTASADQNDSRYYMNLGNQYFLKQQYQQAIEPYQKALDLEKQNPKLDKNMWRVLLDQLGMSYGISGNLDKAEVVFQYGLSKDPDYPMFSYNMACDYAERGNLDQTLAFLMQAFANKQNIIPGETMPDPRTDDSFQRFLNNPKFQALMKELNIH